MVLSHQLLTAEAWIQYWANPCGVYVGHSGPGTGLSSSSLRRSLLSIIPQVFRHYSSVTGRCMIAAFDIVLKL
jgi:hypothetical protein